MHTLEPTCWATSLSAWRTASTDPLPSKIIDSSGPLYMSTTALNLLLVSRRISLIGFFDWLRGSICEGAKRIRSTCLPGMVMILGAPDAGFKELDVAKPGIGVSIREEEVLDKCDDSCVPLDELLAIAKFRPGNLPAPQAVGTIGGGRKFDAPPNAGNSSSDCTSKIGLS